MHKKNCTTPKAQANGFSLIEVLVSILIIALGIMGTSALLIKGMSNAKTASLRSVAALQATSLASSMYANRAFWAVRENAITFKSTDKTVSSKSSNIDTSKTSCTTATCTPAQLAGLDLVTWASSLGTALPDAKSDVSCPTVVNNSARNCTIKISWTERFNDAGKNTVTASAGTSGERNYFLHVEP